MRLGGGRLMRPFAPASAARFRARFKDSRAAHRAYAKRLSLLRELRTKIRRGEPVDLTAIKSLTPGETAFVHGKGSDYDIPKDIKTDGERG